MRCDAWLSRSGVFEYRNADGTVRREYRPPEEVFRDDTMSSFSLVPVTHNHPPEPLNAHNTRQHMVGAVGETIRRDGSKVRASLIITDAETIEAMRKGRNQVSCGYDVDLVDEPGMTPTGERYDARQTNIRGNHVAIVDLGRAGPEAIVRMDSADAAMIRRDEDSLEDCAKRAGGNLSVAKDEDGGVIVSGKDKDGEEVSRRFEDEAEARKFLESMAGGEEKEDEDEDEEREDSATSGLDRATRGKVMEELQKKLASALAQVAAEKARADSAEVALAKMKRRADKAEGERDAEKVRADNAEKERKDAVDLTPTRVRERVELETRALAILGKDTDLSKMSDREVRVAVVKRVDGADIDDKRSDDYVSARYDSALERAQRADAAIGDARALIVAGRQDASGDPEVAARQRMVERNRTLYQSHLQKGN